MSEAPLAANTRAKDAESIQKFQKISEIARLVHESRNLHEALRRLTEGVCMHSNWSTSTIQALDLERHMTMPIVRYDPVRPRSDTLMRQWEASGSPLVRIVETGQPMVLSDASEQDDYPNFQEDAIRRGYRTVVLIPLKFPDAEGRAIVFSVYSFKVVEVDEAEMGFLQCLADLADIAVRRMQAMAKESADAQEMRELVANMTEALATTLELERSQDFLRILSRLFPTGWFAVDLTTGRALTDGDANAELMNVIQPRIPDAIIQQTLSRGPARGGQTVTTNLPDGSSLRTHVRSLDIDGSRVGALFLVDPSEMTPQAEIALQAGQFALSTLILRNYVAFRVRGHSAQRLMKRLFNGDLNNHEELLEEAGVLDFELNGVMRLLAIRCPPREALDDGAYGFVIRRVQQSFGQAVSCTINETVYFLLHDSDEIVDPQSRDAFYERVRPAIPDQAPITVSDPIPNLEQISEAHQVCDRNLRIAESMGARGWISGGNVGAFATLMASLSETMTNDFLIKTIEPIADGGSNKGRVALETLSTYLANARRLQDSADVLGIHVSTMRYRLERLSERHNLNLSDSEQCFELELALRLYRLRKSYKT
ncbi:helix-turn-helix domain-containing protein [Roseovarius salis]|uniref:helix-turn-helix domain-containing protein n=1 Tax=Roseovarius salis TaxID=3376063 RepID=UPI0037C538CE